MRPPDIKNKQDFGDFLGKAKAETEAALKSLPGDPMLKAVAAELALMSQCLELDRAPTKDERDKINVGLIGLRCYEDEFPEYAHWLSELDYAFKRWENL